jgi:xylulokinase
MSYGHPVKPYWNLSGIINTTGKAVEWVSSILGLTGIEDFFSLAGESRAGSGGLVFLPYLAGERAPLWNPSIRGLWRGLNINSTRSDFANSILEGIGFAIKDIITVMEESGEKVKQLRVTGGIAGNAFFNQIKADITGIEILEPVQKEGELLGLAVIGSCFLGKYPSFGEASSAMVRIDTHYEPNQKNAGLYNEIFEKYRKSRNLL